MAPAPPLRTHSQNFSDVQAQLLRAPSDGSTERQRITTATDAAATIVTAVTPNGMEPTQKVASWQDRCLELQTEVRQKSLSIEALRATVETLEALYQESMLKCEKLHFQLSALTYGPMPLYVTDGNKSHKKKHNHQAPTKKAGSKRSSSLRKSTKKSKVPQDGNGKKEKSKGKPTSPILKQVKKKRRRRKADASGGNSADATATTSTAVDGGHTNANMAETSARLLDKFMKACEVTVDEKEDNEEDSLPNSVDSDELEENEEDDSSVESEDSATDDSMNSAVSEGSHSKTGKQNDGSEDVQDDLDITEPVENDKLIAAASEFEEDVADEADTSYAGEDDNSEITDDQSATSQDANDEDDDDDDDEEPSHKSEEGPASPPVAPTTTATKSVSHPNISKEEAAIVEKLGDGPLRRTFLYMLLQRDQTFLLNLQLQRRLNEKEKRVDELTDQLNFSSFVSLRKTMPKDKSDIAEIVTPEKTQNRGGGTTNTHSSGGDALRSIKRTISKGSKKSLKWLAKGQKVAKRKKKNGDDRDTESVSSSEERIEAESPRMSAKSRSLRLRPFHSPASSNMTRPITNQPRTALQDNRGEDVSGWRLGRQGALLVPNTSGRKSKEAVHGGIVPDNDVETMTFAPIQPPPPAESTAAASSLSPLFASDSPPARSANRMMKGRRMP